MIATSAGRDTRSASRGSGAERSFAPRDSSVVALLTAGIPPEDVVEACFDVMMVRQVCRSDHVPTLVRLAHEGRLPVKFTMPLAEPLAARFPHS